MAAVLSSQIKLVIKDLKQGELFFNDEKTALTGLTIFH